VTATETVAVREDAPTATERYSRILLATEGRKIPEAAIARVVELADPAGATAHVFCIARIHGVSFGLQSPGLMPNKRERDDAKENVTRAVKRLKKKGVYAEGHILATRKSTKRIVQEAAKEGCEAIVMAADPDRNRFVSDFLWEQEPQRVRRKAKIPVFLVVDDS
jgi:nucleotide-binding universal stress UspA family protein